MVRPNPSFYTSIVASAIVGALAYWFFHATGRKGVVIAVMCFAMLGAISAIVHDEVQWRSR